MLLKKIYLETDLEGVAGVVSFETQAYDTGKYYEQAKLLLTAEINAAIEGFLEAGVEDILVADGHGCGAVHYETLHPEAKLLHGRPLAPQSVYDPIVAQYEACALIGQHARCGVADGNMNHTQSSRTIEYYRLNGREIGEIAQFALYQGALGLPLIFITGDEAACGEARELVPDIITAAVKQGLSRGCAISLAPATARQLVREQARSAVQKHNERAIAPLAWPGPYTLEKRFLFTDCADSFETHPGYTRLDAKTVQIQSANIKDIIYA